MFRILFGLALMTAIFTAIVSIHSSVEVFFDLLSFLFVVGTTVAGTIISFPLSSLVEAMIPGRATTNEAKARKVLVFHRLADIAVSSGLAGTVIGLVIMLTKLDDPTQIGPAMAVALLTLLYGVLIGEMWLRGVAASTSASMDAAPDLSSRRGAVSIYMPLLGLFALVTTFLLMLLAMGDFG